LRRPVISDAALKSCRICLAVHAWGVRCGSSRGGVVGQTETCPRRASHVQRAWILSRLPFIVGTDSLRSSSERINNAIESSDRSPTHGSLPMALARSLRAIRYCERVCSLRILVLSRKKRFSHTSRNSASLSINIAAPCYVLSPCGCTHVTKSVGLCRP